MLTKKRLSFTAMSVVDDAEIASFSAVLNAETNDLSFYTRQIDKEACEENRDIVRADQAEFEDLAYLVKNTVKNG